MQVGEGSHWLGVLVGALFTAILLPLLVGTLASLLRRLGRGTSLLLRGKAQWSGLTGMGRKLREEMLFVVVFCVSIVFSSLILLVSLVNYFPTIGTWSPLTTLLTWIVDDSKLQQELGRGVDEQDAGLIQLALTMGADARNPGEKESYLPRSRSPDLRQLLVEYGASPNGLRHQEPPLLQALEIRDFELYQWLLQAGANPDPRMHAPDEHLIVLLARSEPALGDEWLTALLRHDRDLNRRSATGTTALDVMTLERVRPDWHTMLSEAGARHGLLLDRGEYMPADHPAITHVRQWLGARGTADWLEGDERWELPGADATGIYYFLPVKDIQLTGRIEGNEALVRASGPAGGGPERTTVVALRWIQAEAAEPIAQADPATRGWSHGSWRIAGFWLDKR